MSDKKLNVCIVGYGHLGKWHLQKAVNSSHTGKVFLVDVDKSALEKAKSEYGDLTVTTDVNEFIDEIDAAIIVTPTSLHYEMLDFFLKNDKHVFCEKPVTESVEQAYKIRDLLKTKDLVVQVGHSERFHGIWEKLETWSELINSPSTIKLDRLAPFKGRATDVDCVQDLMIHDIDLMLHIFKEMPTSVSSTGYKMRTPKWDYVCSSFKFNSGRSCHITVGRNNSEEVRKLDITGKSGNLQIDLFRSDVKWAPSNENDPEKFVSKSSYEKRDHLNIEHERFYSSILNKLPPVVSLEDGINAVELVGLVLKSLEVGGDIVIPKHG